MSGYPKLKNKEKLSPAGTGILEDEMEPRKTLFEWLLDLGLKKALGLVWAIFFSCWLLAMGILLAYLHYRERI